MARTLTLESWSSSRPMATAVCDALWGSMPIITFMTASLVVLETTGALLLADCSVLDPLLSHSVAKSERETLRTKASRLTPTAGTFESDPAGTSKRYESTAAPAASLKQAPWGQAILMAGHSLSAIPPVRHDGAMPPFLDVYARVERRDPAILDSFLGEFMYGWEDDDRWLDEEPVNQAFERAFGDSTTSFARYGRSSTSGIASVIVAFGRDGSMILGVSIEGEDEAEADARAPDLIDALNGESGCLNGYGRLGGASTIGPDRVGSGAGDSGRATRCNPPVSDDTERVRGCPHAPGVGAACGTL